MDEGLLEEAEKISRISPIAWTHINFGGQYHFGEKSDSIIEERVTGIVKEDDSKSAL